MTTASHDVPDISWLFVCTLPNSGSTALAKVLSAGRNAVLLNENGEGQWLVPEMSRNVTRWRPDLQVDCPAVRTAWLAAVDQTSVRPCVVIEKSPPNLLRVDQLKRCFADMPSGTILFTRDPYAVCASWIGRYSWFRLWLEWERDYRLLVRNHTFFVRKVGQIFGRLMERMAHLSETCDILVTYEQFCDAPESTLQDIAQRFPLLGDVRADVVFTVKDYDAQGLQNMNDMQVAALSETEREILYETLKPFASSLGAFGYQL